METVGSGAGAGSRCMPHTVVLVVRLHFIKIISTLSFLSITGYRWSNLPVTICGSLSISRSRIYIGRLSISGRGIYIGRLSISGCGIYSGRLSISRGRSRIYTGRLPISRSRSRIYTGRLSISRGSSRRGRSCGKIPPTKNLLVHGQQLRFIFDALKQRLMIRDFLSLW